VAIKQYYLCPNGHKVDMYPYEKKACSKCGKVVIGPEAK